MQDSNTTTSEALIYHLGVSDNGAHDGYFVACLGTLDSIHFFLSF